MIKWVIPAFILLAGCGYRHYPTTAQYSFDVPFIQGDKDGQLTGSVIQALSKSPFFRYDAHHAQVQIVGKIVSNEVEQIGYQYRMQDNDSEVQHRLVPNEGRRIIKVEFSLIGIKDTEPFVAQIEGNAEFDFVDPDSFKDLAFDSPSGNLVTILDFSLGQLDSEEGAKLASFFPCYQQIALKFRENLDRYLSHIQEKDED